MMNWAAHGQAFLAKPSSDGVNFTLVDSVESARVLCPAAHISITVIALQILNDRGA
jgi:hypothetical protein